MNPLTDDKILNWSKLEQILDDNFKFSNGEENIVRKEKLLVTSSFCFSHHVFHSYISLARQSTALCGNGLKFDLFGSEFSALLLIFLKNENEMFVFGVYRNQLVGPFVGL